MRTEKGIRRHFWRPGPNIQETQEKGLVIARSERDKTAAFGVIGGESLGRERMEREQRRRKQPSKELDLHFLVLH